MTAMSKSQVGFPHKFTEALEIRGYGQAAHRHSNQLSNGRSEPTAARIVDRTLCCTTEQALCESSTARVLHPVRSVNLMPTDLTHVTDIR